MRDSLLPYLCCPESRTPLTLEVDERDVGTGVIRRGQLRSASGRVYPIAHGVPHLHSTFRSRAEAQTVAAFGAEWARYDDFEGYMGSASLFTEFTGLSAADVAGKRILEVGCGGGRWLKVMADLGAREVVGLDLSTAVEQASRRTASLPNVHVVRGSALEMPLAAAFDLVVSIGVVHHLDDPVEGLRGMQRAVVPEHNVAIWVYGREGNELYLSVIGPLRRVSTHVPGPALAVGSKLLAAGLWLHMHTVNKSAVALGVPLPLRDYLAMLAKLRFKDIESVVYDQLTPQLARYPTRTEVESWVNDAGGAVQRMYHRTQNSWQCHFRFTPRDAA